MTSSAQVANLVADLRKDRAIGEADPGLWDTVRALGLPGIGVAEDRGGSGGTMADLATVVLEFAARGVRLPIAETAIAGWVLQNDRDRRGGAATVAVLDDAVVAGGRLSATIRGVVGCTVPGHLVLLVRNQPAPLVVDTASAGVRIVAGVDLAGTATDELHLRDVPVVEVAADAQEALARLAVLRAAGLVGAARGAYHLTSSHLRTREQFGKPLVAIPIVATSLASLRVELLQAQTALTMAVEGAQSTAGGRATAAATAARIVAASAATGIAGRAHQLHGAIGTTAEYALHHLTRLLWAGRDVDLPEPHWAAQLGSQALEAGEEDVWDTLTAPEPDLSSENSTPAEVTS
ncbi:MAG: acyl-CoA dehydrogenase family protein [Sporichthyaceae bacterium]